MVKLPIFIADKGGFDVSVYTSIQSAQLHLEPIDVINVEFVGYDAEGRLLELSVTGDKKTPMYHRKIIIKAGEEETNHASDLREALTRLFSYLQVPKDWISQASLKDLVTKAQEFKTE